MRNRRNYYRILQVQPDAPSEIIRASYRTLMRELKQHPDLGGAVYDAAILNEAYEVLSDPNRRAVYDLVLFEHYTKRDTGNSDRRSLTTVFCPVCRRPLARKPRPGERCPGCQSPLQSEDPAVLDGACRRSLLRTKRNTEITYYSGWPGKARKAGMVDFSPGGMRFLCGERIARGTVLKICSSFLEASAKVTNLREETVDGRRLYAIGVAFLAVSFADPKGSFLSTSA